MVFNIDLYNPPIKVAASKETTATANAPPTAETPVNTSTNAEPSKSKRFGLFSKRQKPAQEQTRLVDKTEEQIQEEQKNKVLIMKYRNMTEEEADKYLEQKKLGKDRMNAERGLRAIGMALAPVRM